MRALLIRYNDSDMAWENLTATFLQSDDGQVILAQIEGGEAELLSLSVVKGQVEVRKAIVERQELETERGDVEEQDEQYEIYTWELV